MDQFDVHRLRGPEGRSARVDFVVILQHRFIDPLETCVVAPLMPIERLPSLERLRPIVTSEDHELVVAIDRLAALERRSIGSTAGSLAAYHDEIIAALDLLFTGY